MKKKIAVWTAVVVASFSVGAIAGTSTPAETAQPTAAKAEVRTITKTKTVSQTPAECVAALEGWKEIGRKLNRANVDYLSAGQAEASLNISTASSHIKAGTREVRSATKELKEVVGPATSTCEDAAK